MASKSCASFDFEFHFVHPPIGISKLTQEDITICLEMARTIFVSEMKIKRETKHETIKLTSHKRHEFGDPTAKPSLATTKMMGTLK